MKTKLLSLYCWYIVILGMVSDHRPIREITQAIAQVR